ncbi:MAG: hypothetical protein QOD67_242 [Caballeronia sp.]|nr:hypothetical protein [Caballeronia sp.]
MRVCYIIFVDCLHSKHSYLYSNDTTREHCFSSLQFGKVGSGVRDYFVGQGLTHFWRLCFLAG